MKTPTFNGRESVLLSRVNSRGHLPVNDTDLAARGWFLVTAETLYSHLVSEDKLILAVPLWGRGAGSPCPSRLTVHTNWEGVEDLARKYFDPVGRNRGLVFAKRVDPARLVEEAEAEGSFFFMHAVRGMHN